MHISTETLDDALIELYPRLIASSNTVKTTRGDTTELLGVTIEISNARMRLSRSATRGKLFSSVGELLWYLGRDNKLEFIERYVPHYREESEDGITVHGGYGPRFFAQRGVNQIENVINLLRNRESSRRAVIQLFNAEDLTQKFKEIPCTTTLQFLVRDGKLHLIVTMRSNDAFLGLPHDVFCFTMIQEIVAVTLGLQLGVYRHFAGSMHMYARHKDKAEIFVKEGYQSRIAMPPMPIEDPWKTIATVLDAEKSIRNGKEIDANALGLGDYWADIVRIVQVFFSKNAVEIAALNDLMAFPRFRPYIMRRA